MVLQYDTYQLISLLPIKMAGGLHHFNFSVHYELLKHVGLYLQSFFTSHISSILGSACPCVWVQQ